MHQTTDDTTPRRPKRTPCTNCRQQKAKCDAEEGSGKPCSRCAKLNAKCVVATEFKREMKRKRADDPTSPVAATNRTSSGIPTPLSVSNGVESTDGPTISRTLDDIFLDASVIDGLFDTFFQRYHPFLPILDPLTLPNAYFARCPLTFFCIVAVAAQKNSPGLSSALSTSVYNLALVSPRMKENYFNSIHAILLLITWPLERSPDNSSTFPLSATLIHMALAQGLHVPLFTSEFQRRGQKLTDSDISHRAALWAQVQIAYARCTIFKGITAFSIEQRLGDTTTASKVPMELRFHRRVHFTVLKFFEAAQKVGLKKMELEQDRALGVLIAVFEDQLTNIADEPQGEMDKIYVAMARLQILTYHFFRIQGNVTSQALANIYNTCNAIIMAVQRLESSMQLYSVAPFYVCAGVLLAAHVLLRIGKCYVHEPWLDPTEAETSFYEAIAVCKGLSKDKVDICSRCSYRMLQIWQSKRAFRKPDGSSDFEVRVKSRQALSVFLDVIWRWREEFEPIATQSISEGVDSLPAIEPNGGAASDLSAAVNEPFLFDFGLDLDFSQDWLATPTADAIFSG